jgi:hypothetical protein
MMKLRDELIGSLSLALAREGWRGLAGGSRLFWGGVLDAPLAELGGTDVDKLALYYCAYHYPLLDLHVIFLIFKSFPASQ